MATYNQFGLNIPLQAGFDIPLQLTPGNTLSDGIAPAGKFMVASYLPTLRKNVERFAWVVISSGKIVGLDTNGYVVPAGLRLEAAAYAAALVTSVAAADAQAVVHYTANDVTLGVKNFKGVLVTAGEPVVKSWFTGSTLNNVVSPFVGLVVSDCFQFAGGNNENPALLNYTNFNIQPTIAFLADYHMQYPMAKDAASIRTAPLAGIAGFVGTPAQFGYGSFVTYDRESNFVPANTTGDFQGFGSTDPSTIVGQILSYRVFKDPTSGAVLQANNMLDKVIAPNQATASVLNQIPSSANQGQPTFVTYSNGYGVVEFGITTR